MTLFLHLHTGITVTCSIYTLMALSIDHYMTAKTPRRDKRLNGKLQTVALLVAIWLVSAGFLAPVLHVREVNSVRFDQVHVTASYCVERWTVPTDRHAYAVFLLLFTYVLPIGVIVVSYTLVGRILCSSADCRLHHVSTPSSCQGVSATTCAVAAAGVAPTAGRLAVQTDRRAIMRLLVIIIAVFVVCWLPYNVISLLSDVSLDVKLARLLPFALWLGHAHSAVNPVVYWFFNKTFRHCISNVVRCSLLRKRRRDSRSSQYV